VPAARSVHRGVYHSDIKSTDYSRRVDDHLFTQAGIGWVAVTGVMDPLPSTMKPRHALGRDATGRQHSLTIPVTTSTIWDQSVPTWNILDDTGALIAVTLTGLVGESMTF